MNASEYTNVKINLPLTEGEPIVKTVGFINDGFTLFFNAQHLLLKLTVIERSFFDFTCEVMRIGDNDITIDEGVKTKFQEHLMQVSGGKKTVTLNQLTKYVQKLSGLYLILRTQNKGRYIVNPKYVFKSGAPARKKYMKRLIENRMALKLPLKGLLHIPESEFLKIKDGKK